VLHPYTHGELAKQEPAASREDHCTKEQHVSTLEPEQHVSSPDPNGTSTHLRFIEELAGPDDAWITITDAARITRTSEAMARRWVASGRLPIRRQPAGVNQQTRLVRLSDVAAIRPIIDPTAAISDEVHKLDLPSIPRQQAQIMQEHERLLVQVQQEQQAVDVLHHNLHETARQQRQALEDLRHQYSARQDEMQRELTREQQQYDHLAEQVHHQAHLLEQTNQHLVEQEQQIQHDIDLLRTTMMDQLKQVQRTSEQKLSELDQRYRHYTEQMRSEIMSLLQQEQERVHAVLDAMRETLTRLDQDREQLRHELAMQQEALMLQRTQVAELIDQQVREVKTEIEQHISEYVQDKNALHAHLQSIERWQEQQRAQAYQQRIEGQDQLIQELMAQLQEERVARFALSNQLKAVPQQIEALRREIERRDVQAPETEA
jgi:hypothetical protein